ncbi:MAG: hypothetical protein KF894_29235 [Labilithrix sp.]|nr:hypothetical protein [Labilithrix sp.]
MTAPREIDWLAEHVDEGEVCFRVGRCGDDVVAEWGGLATLTARRDGTDVRLHFDPDADPRDVKKIERGSAWLLVRHLRDRLGLHGAAVSFDGDAVVLLGRSGQGKSTLAAAACRRGAALLADDAVGLDEMASGWEVIPNELDHWLDAASRQALGASSVEAAKLPLRASRAAEAGARLVAFVDLAFVDGPPRLVSLGGIAAVGTLVPQVARFILDEPERQRRELDLLHSIVAVTPVFRLERPRTFDDLDRAVDLVMNLMGRPEQRG